MLGCLIEAERFEHRVRGIEYRAAGRFVHAAGLHPDKPVFHNIRKADAVCAA